LQQFAIDCLGKHEREILAMIRHVSVNTWSRAPRGSAVSEKSSAALSISRYVKLLVGTLANAFRPVTDGAIKHTD